MGEKEVGATEKEDFKKFEKEMYEKGGTKFLKNENRNRKMKENE